jgi:predicted ATP-binding protein involved in virulence
LQAVRQAIRKCCNGIYSLQTCRFAPGCDVPDLRVTKTDGNEHSVAYLSEGEKCLLAMVTDLARRLVIANPHAENPLDGDGVVLIDELELHLHPTVQHTIISNLLETFPNCQFLITTNSPHIVTHTPPKSLFIVQNQDGKVTVEQPKESYGKDAEQILRDILDLPSSRPDRIKNELDKIHSLLGDQQYRKAEFAIKVLREEIGDDTELIRLNSFAESYHG